MFWQQVLQAIGAVAASLVLAFLVASAIVVLGFRARSPRIRRSIARLNRSVSNPRQLETAGQPGAPFSVVRHRGRVSGREFTTPVGALREGGTVVVPLPYDTGADWVQNVLSAGEAQLECEGSTLRLVRPRIVPVESIRASLPRGDRFATRLFRVTDALEADVDD